MFLTDGTLERNGNADVQAQLRAAADLHPREAVQHLIQAVVVARGGPLRDDATAMCLDWHGSRAASPGDTQIRQAGRGEAGDR